MPSLLAVIINKQGKNKVIQVQTGTDWMMVYVLICAYNLKYQISNMEFQQSKFLEMEYEPQKVNVKYLRNQ